MNKKLKLFLMAIGIALLLGVLAFVSLGLYTDYRLGKTYEIKPRAISVLSDSASLEKGQRLATLLCTHCHGGDFTGKHFFHDDDLGDIYSPNLTPGEGGIGKAYTDEDWTRVLRHGVKKNGHPTLIMSSSAIRNLTDADLGSLIGFLKSLPPVNKAKGTDNVKFFTKFLVSAGAFGDVISAEIIDHTDMKPIPEPNRDDAISLGKYLVNINGCQECHGAEFNGQKSPNPHAPFGANITMGGNLKNWSDKDFMTVLRSGKTPEGKQMDDEFMPWKSLAAMTDDELNALYTYLRSLPAKPTPEH